MYNKTMSFYEQDRWKKTLMQYEWTETITVTAYENTVSGLWLSVSEGLSSAFVHNPSLRYFIVGAVGKLNGMNHYHGLIFNNHRSLYRFNAGFKQCYRPHRTPIWHLEGWCDYILGQALQDYQITNIQEIPNEKEIFPSRHIMHH